ncbi:Hypothetical predicted protein [Cloeon dipterum]|uniref:Uncharacterized protein n=1 Tax=Cloeon dipterum TaxID=197152 RepID=A0A8S1C4H3_9INSE|nr:Hypothetical predicted protein [Cloeon dipterum]
MISKFLLVLSWSRYIPSVRTAPISDLTTDFKFWNETDTWVKDTVEPVEYFPKDEGFIEMPKEASIVTTTKPTTTTTTTPPTTTTTKTPTDYSNLSGVAGRKLLSFSLQEDFEKSNLPVDGQKTYNDDDNSTNYPEYNNSDNADNEKTTRKSKSKTYYHLNTSHNDSKTDNDSNADNDSNTNNDIKTDNDSKNDNNQNAANY